MANVANLIQTIENKNFRFHPNREFYGSIRIGRKRFWQIYRNEKSPTIEELENIAKYFEVNILDLIVSK